MKKKRSVRVIAIVLVGIGVIITNCKRNNEDNPGGNSAKNHIVIKGNISGTLKSAPSLMDAKKIFAVNVLHGSLISNFVDIKDGVFADTAEIGIAQALVFLDENNKYIGTLSNRGLNLLPLCNLTAGENTTIDLANLTLTGTIITPSHDPFGNEITINEAQITSLKDVDGFFETLAKNIDTDNDNVLDAIDQKQLFLKSRFTITGGKWGLNNSAPILSDSSINNLGYALEVDGDKGFSMPNSVTLSGPAGSPNMDYKTICLNSDGNGGFYSVILSQQGTNFMPFKKGIYTFTIDGNAHTLDYSNIDAKNNLLLVCPTLITNSEGKLVSISLDYKLPDHSSIDPVNILTDVMVQFGDFSGNQFYNSPRLINTYAEAVNCNCVKGLNSYTLDNPLDISKLKTITIFYDDLLGNTYFINWYK